MVGERQEVRFERLYVKVPGSDKLRRTAAGRLRVLLAAGWRETKRDQETDYVHVRLERTGFKTPMRKLPYVEPQQPRQRRDNRGGPGGGGQGGPGGPRGGQGAPPAPAAAAAPTATPEPTPAAPAPAS